MGSVFAIRVCSLGLILLFLSVYACAEPAPVKPAKVLHTEAIDRVWSGHDIYPTMLVHREHQFMAYYDANRQMTFAYRKDNAPWVYHKVNSWVGWDRHNYIALSLDEEGYLHASGNMHGDPLEYFRSQRPFDVRSLKRIAVMVEGGPEKRMTYPRFLKDQNGRLYFTYRHGGSGNGNQIYNVYNTKKRRWTRLHQQAFLDGEGKMSGYFEGPTLGPDGYFHLIWVWRDTPDASTNHDISYARSKDLLVWEDSNGKPYELPLTLNEVEIVAPVPVKAGMINGNVNLGFDGSGKPIIVYHRYDELGYTQMYIARKQGEAWISSAFSDWQNFRWEFGGGGSLGVFPIDPKNPELTEDGKISARVRKHDKHVNFLLDPTTYERLSVETYEPTPHVVYENAERLLSKTDVDLELNVKPGPMVYPSSDQQYYMTWYSLPGNRDKAHSKIPQPSTLLLQKIQH